MGAKRRTVLIVGDDPGIRDVSARLLASRGYRVLTSGNAEAAMGMCDVHRPEIVLLDAIVERDPWQAMVDQLVTRGEAAPRVVIMTGPWTEEITPDQETPDRSSSVRRLRAPFRADDLLDLVNELSAA